MVDRARVLERVTALRRSLSERGVCGYFLPRASAFYGEEISEDDARLEWLTGFTGSFGACVVEHDRALLIVDPRYGLQVQEEVPLDLFEPYVLKGAERVEDVVIARLREGAVLGYDPWVVTIAQGQRLVREAALRGINLVPLTPHVVDGLWADRPVRKTSHIRPHPVAFSGRSALEKLEDICPKLKGPTLISALDSIAWILNIRGSAFAHTPLVKARLLLFPEGKGSLFLEDVEEAGEVVSALEQARISVAGMADFALKIEALWALGETLFCEFQSTPWAVGCGFSASSVEESTRVKDAPDPCVLPKARKTNQEQDGARRAHGRDGRALVRFFAWLDGQAEKGNFPDECEVCAALLGFRRREEGFWGPSFATIAASGPNGAVIHYHPGPRTNRRLAWGESFLLDSGGQYGEGTTDVTRTVAFGSQDFDYRAQYTAVLRGLIALSRAVFPEGTTGGQLDVLARGPLWALGLDFEHGTGHGVGSFLSVHEGPQRFSKMDRTPLEPGMMLSNEPGYYRPGCYGIRLENILLVQRLWEREGKAFMGFETLTLCPFDRASISVPHLHAEEKEWIDLYHARVWEALWPDLEPEEQEWLRVATAPL